MPNNETLSELQSYAGALEVYFSHQVENCDDADQLEQLAYDEGKVEAIARLLSHENANQLSAALLLHIKSELETSHEVTGLTFVQLNEYEGD
jgi:hypothetical protein